MQNDEFYSHLPNAGLPTELWDAKVRQEWPTQGLSSWLFFRIRFHGLHAWVPPAPSMKLTPQFIFSFLSRMCPQDKHVVTHLSCRFCLLCGSLWCDTPCVGKAACSPGPPSHVSAKSPGPVYTRSRLNVCGPHQIHMWKLIPNVKVLGGGAPGSLGISSLVKGSPERDFARQALLPCDENTAWRQLARNQEAALPRPQLFWCLGLGLLSLENREKYMLVV